MLRMQTLIETALYLIVPDYQHEIANLQRSVKARVGENELVPREFAQSVAHILEESILERKKGKLTRSVWLLPISEPRLASRYGRIDPTHPTRSTSSRLMRTPTISSTPPKGTPGSGN